MAWKYRQVQIEDDLAVADSGTKTFDIKVKDPLTALIIRFKAANGAAQVPDFQPEEAITKVELTDGGQVYWALNGPMAVAASVYGLDRWPRQWYDERANNNQRINFPIMFGRYIGDEQYAFTPTRLVNPQLKITWADTALFLDDSLTIGLTAQVMEGLSAPPSMLAWKEVESWTTASSGEHKVELPTDYTIRALMMRPYVVSNLWGNIWTNFKLDCDMGKFIPFDLEDHELGDILRQEFGPYQVGMHHVLTHNETTQLPMGEVIQVAGGAVGTPYAITLYTAGAWGYMIPYLIDVAGAFGTDVPIEDLVTGFYPHWSLLWPFGKWMDPATWFSPKREGYGAVDLKLTEGVASADGRVAVQQIRPLP